MAEPSPPARESNQSANMATTVPPTVPDGSSKPKRGPPAHQIYSQPAPIRTFPLPTFYPNNPVSVFYVAYAWIRQVLSPPPSEPSVVHEGTWSEATCSVHVTVDTSVRALWEQGFYGKGSLSRSEPNWLKREQVRRGLEGTHVSEILTVQRREERLRAKWERARLEQEVIRQTREAEALEAERRRAAAKSTPVAATPTPALTPTPAPKPTPKAAVPKPQRPAKTQPTKQASPALPVAPTGPLELLALPNSEIELLQVLAPRSQSIKPFIRLPPIGPLELLALPNSAADLDKMASQSPLSQSEPIQVTVLPPVGPLELLALPNSAADLVQQIMEETIEELEEPIEEPAEEPSEEVIEEPVEADVVVESESLGIHMNGSTETKLDTEPATTLTNGSAKPTVIPGLHKLKAQKSVHFSPEVKSATFQVSDPPSPPEKQKQRDAAQPNGDALTTIVNKEHLQLMPEEALWLSFGLGALAVKDPSTGRQLSNRELLTLFRQHSYFPPRAGPDDPDLQPDDDFLVHYAVYHHFRSLGWVPRAGIKFGVDWLLYTRGPVFDHAEFGLVVVPSYSDPWWATSPGANKRPAQTWHGLHSVIRVLSQVMKSLVLVYVDVPAPQRLEQALEQGGLADALRLYRVREMMVKRWSSNRNR